MANNDLNQATLAEVLADENKAREFLEAKRWPNGAVCPRCGCTEVYKLTAKPESKSPVRPGVYKCSECRKQFTVRIGTIFEESKIEVRKWLMAIHLMTSSKKGVSSHQIAQELGISIKSAWFLTHRIREAMRQEPMVGMLKLAVEVDETYVGGKPRIKGVSRRGRGTSKAPVIVLVERESNGVRRKPIQGADSKTLREEISTYIDKEAVILNG